RLVMACRAVLRGGFHIHGDGGVRGNTEKQDLGGTGTENVFRRPGAFRQFAVEKGGNHLIDRAKAADRGGGNGASKGAVARCRLRECAAGCFLGKGLVKRAAALQHGGENGGGALPGGKARVAGLPVHGRVNAQGRGPRKAVSPLTPGATDGVPPRLSQAAEGCDAVCR